MPQSSRTFEKRVWMLGAETEKKKKKKRNCLELSWLSFTVWLKQSLYAGVEWKIAPSKKWKQNSNDETIRLEFRSQKTLKKSLAAQSTRFHGQRWKEEKKLLSAFQTSAVSSLLLLLVRLKQLWILLSTLLLAERSESLKINPPHPHSA